MEEKTFLVTRPRIASALMVNGLHCEIIPHPWKPNLTAWDFTVTDENTKLVEEVFESFGLNPPHLYRKQKKQ